MNLLGLFGNKSVVNGMLDLLRKHMLKEDISGIVLLRSDNEDGETPGVDVKQYAGRMGIIDGEEDVEFVTRCFEARSHILEHAPNREDFNSLDFDMWQHVIYGAPKKEVSDGL